MDTFLVILIMVAIVVGMILWQKLTKAATRKLNQSLRPKDHKSGRELVSQRHEFSSVAPASQLSKAIQSSVLAAPSAPALKPTLFVASSSDSLMVYEFGSKMQTVFRIVVNVETTASKSKGSFQVANWTLVDGIVGRQKEMRSLFETIESAIRSVDSSATFRVVG